MRHAAVLLLLAAAACRSASVIDDRVPTPIKGRVEGMHRTPPAARIQVYRLDASGGITLLPFEWATPDRLGRFATHPLGPGRYRLAYRSGEGPPSIGTAKIPGEANVTLRPMPTTGLVRLRVSTSRTDPQPVRCRLSEADPPFGIADMREFMCSPAAPVFLPALRPGRWRVDVPAIGATTEIDVPAGGGEASVSLDIPNLDAGASISGEVLRLAGTPAAYVVVSARSLRDDGAAAVAWGRYGITDRAGRYMIVGIPPGRALVRVACGEVRYRILPSPHEVPIPPSGKLELGVLVEP